MTIEIKVPELPESVADGMLLEWHKWWNDALGVVDDELDPAGRWLNHRYDIHGREVQLWSCPPEIACTSRDQATLLLRKKIYDDTITPRRIVTKRYISAPPGTCEAGCGPNSSCSDGECVCRADWGNCNNNWEDGCERDLRTPTNCGACSHSCVNSSKGSACVLSRDQGWSCGCLNNSDCPFGFECGPESVCRPAA
jgi:hypothetical protein